MVHFEVDQSKELNSREKLVLMNHNGGPCTHTLCGCNGIPPEEKLTLREINDALGNRPARFVSIWRTRNDYLSI